MKVNSNVTVTSSGDGISRIKIDDPSNYNALSSKNIYSLISIFEKLNNDRHIIEDTICTLVSYQGMNNYVIDAGGCLLLADGDDEVKLI